MSKPIPYTSGSINPVTGCKKYSRGCASCYAFTWAQRFRGGDFSIHYHPEKLDVIRRKKSGLWFVGSMTDLFQDGIEFSRVADIINTIAVNPKAKFLVLTKRAKNMASFFRACPAPANLGIGVTAEGQQEWDERVPILLSIKAAMRWVSVEPMLESVVADTDDLMRLDWVIVGPETGAKNRECKHSWMEGLWRQTRGTGTPFFDKRNPYRLAREWPDGWGT